MILSSSPHKGGLHRENGVQRHDARPETLLRQCDESLKRLRTDRVELYYLHAPDPNVPVTESAAAIAEMISAGKVRSAGASNLSLEQLESFSRGLPTHRGPAALQTCCSVKLNPT